MKHLLSYFAKFSLGAEEVRRGKRGKNGKLYISWSNFFEI